MPRAVKRSSLTALLFAIAVAGLLVLQIHAIISALPVALDHDEAEYLHATWLMSQGKRIYRDFMEDHPPAFFQFLGFLQPSTTTAELPLLDVKTWAARARVATGLCGTLAAILAAVAVARATRNRAAAVFTSACIVGSYWTNWRGMLEIRADAPSLLLFWGGVALLLWSDGAILRDALRRGLGLALVIFAELINPKWPLCGLVLGAFFLRDLFRVRRDVRAIAAMVLPPLIAIAAMLVQTLRVTTLRDFIFFNFQLKSANMDLFRRAPFIVQSLGPVEPFSFAAAYSRPWVIAVAVIVAAALLRRSPAVNRIAAVQLLALMVAAACEVRFIYTYPYLWPQYYLMWSIAGAAVCGIALSLIEDASARADSMVGVQIVLIASVALSLAISTTILVRLSAGSATPDRAALGVALAAAWVPTLFAIRAVVARRALAASEVVHSWIIVAAIAIGFTGLLVVSHTANRQFAERWTLMSFFQRTLRPHDTVWLRATIHPIAADDASYFWYSPQDLIPDTLEYIRTHPESRRFLPQITEAALPPCAILRGEPSSLRYMSTATVAYLPQSRLCLAELYRRGQIARTPISEIVEVRQLRPAR